MYGGCLLCPLYPLLLLLKTQKSRRAEKNYNNSRSLQENFAHAASSQSTRTILAIQYKKSFVQPLPAVMIHVMTK